MLIRKTQYKCGNEINRKIAFEREEIVSRYIRSSTYTCSIWISLAKMFSSHFKWIKECNQFGSLMVNWNFLVKRLSANGRMYQNV